MPNGFEDEDDPIKPVSERVPGPLADDFEGPLGERSLSGLSPDAAPLADGFEGPLSVENILQRLERLRSDPESEIETGRKEIIERDLKAVTSLLDRESALSVTRSALGAPHGEEELRKLEEAKAVLTEEKEHIDIAEQYNSVFDEFTKLDLSSDDLSYIMEHGTMPSGKGAVHDSKGRPVDSHVMKKLASLYKGGGRRMTRVVAKELNELANKVLSDLASIAKGIVRGAGGEERAA